jgi:hypothetical protein
MNRWQRTSSAKVVSTNVPPDILGASGEVHSGKSHLNECHRRVSRPIGEFYLRHRMNWNRGTKIKL